MVAAKKRVTGSTALHLAASADQKEVARFLVEEAGADLEAKASNGETPLDVARRRDNPQTAAFLEQALEVSCSAAATAWKCGGDVTFTSPCCRFSASGRSSCTSAHRTGTSRARSICWSADCN